MAERTAQNLTTARDNVTEDQIKKWFEEVGDYLEKKGLKSALEEPERVFNTDESAFFYLPSQVKYLRKEAKSMFTALQETKRTISQSLLLGTQQVS